MAPVPAKSFGSVGPASAPQHWFSASFLNHFLFLLQISAVQRIIPDFGTTSDLRKLCWEHLQVSFTIGGEGFGTSCGI
jgi:hypothetical protein